MDNSQLQSQIEQLTNTVTQMTSDLNAMKEKYTKLLNMFSIHQHTDADGSARLRQGGIEKLGNTLDQIYLGNGYLYSDKSGDIYWRNTLTALSTKLN